MTQNISSPARGSMRREVVRGEGFSCAVSGVRNPGSDEHCALKFHVLAMFKRPAFVWGDSQPLPEGFEAGEVVRINHVADATLLPGLKLGGWQYDRSLNRVDVFFGRAVAAGETYAQEKFKGEPSNDLLEYRMIHCEGEQLGGVLRGEDAVAVIDVESPDLYACNGILPNLFQFNGPVEESEIHPPPSVKGGRVASSNIINHFLNHCRIWSIKWEMTEASRQFPYGIFFMTKGVLAHFISTHFRLTLSKVIDRPAFNRIRAGFVAARLKAGVVAGEDLLPGDSRRCGLKRLPLPKIGARCSAWLAQLLSLRNFSVPLLPLGFRWEKFSWSLTNLATKPVIPRLFAPLDAEGVGASRSVGESPYASGFVNRLTLWLPLGCHSGQPIDNDSQPSTTLASLYRTIFQSYPTVQFWTLGGSNLARGCSLVVDWLSVSLNLAEMDSRCEWEAA